MSEALSDLSHPVDKKIYPTWEATVERFDLM